MRTRNIKPGFFHNEHLRSLRHRLFFIGLWCLADREGRLEDRPGKIKAVKAEILPYDAADLDRMLVDLARPQGPDGKHFICRYAVGDRRCIQVLNFIRHQNPHIREAASLLPAPPAEADAKQWASDASILHQASTVLVAKEHQASPADSLIADSLIPDSLIADTLIQNRLLTSAAKMAAEDVRLESFYPTKQIKNPESQTNRYESQTNHPKSPNSCVSPSNGDLIEEEPANPSYPPEFEQFWQQYPRHTEKKWAFRVWQAWIKDRVDAGDLIQVAQHYTAHCRHRRTEPEFIKHPSTFLGLFEVYWDWIEPPRNGGGKGDGRRPDDEEDLNALSF